MHIIVDSNIIFLRSSAEIGDTLNMRRRDL
jgi:hypothetical protein